MLRSVKRGANFTTHREWRRQRWATLAELPVNASAGSRAPRSELPFIV